MGDELVVEGRGVISDFDQIDGHSGDLGDHNSSQGVGDGKICVVELELDHVFGAADDFGLWKL